MNVEEQVRNLERFTVAPPRQTYGHHVGLPTVQSRIIELQQDLAQTRQALRDALALLRMMGD
jgi:hypothetical protein